tara:strand:+ start:3128 stop:3838 length:711 start_codon:yes stop_codon:yes gene_type:complete
MAVTFSDRITISIEPGKDDPVFGSVLGRLVAHLELYRAMGIHKQWIKGAMFNQFVKERYPGQVNSPATMHNPIVSHAVIDVSAGERFHDRINVSIKPGRSSDRNNRMLTEFVEFLDLSKSMGTLQQWVKQACIAQFELMQTGSVQESNTKGQVDQQTGGGERGDPLINNSEPSVVESEVKLVRGESFNSTMDQGASTSRIAQVEDEQVDGVVSGKELDLQEVARPKRKPGIAKLMG